MPELLYDKELVHHLAVHLQQSDEQSLSPLQSTLMSSSELATPAHALIALGRIGGSATFPSPDVVPLLFAPRGAIFVF